MIIFYTLPIPYNCSIPSIPKDSSKCVHFIYNRTVFEETVITEYDLGSSDSPLGNLTQFFLMFGYLLGSVVFGALADLYVLNNILIDFLKYDNNLILTIRYGRRSPLIWSVILQLIFGLLTAFVVPLWQVFVLRFLVGFATGGVSIIR